MAEVAKLPCCVANEHCRGRVTVHHITGGKSLNTRASDFDTIPLCENHHQQGGFGIAVHAGVKTWEARHKVSQRELVERTRKLLTTGR